ncbi:hypothetical protein EYF80_029613 [Liparis tanakae]|uniref:Uncharacterized protein n=1 Tax=Liparis tanakae TaxID=230148 RepID=A0A4Z2H3Z1_9TELE|nr:hypothetical protein EYF80_029613 [Liparis tanakae]
MMPPRLYAYRLSVSRVGLFHNRTGKRSAPRATPNRSPYFSSDPQPQTNKQVITLLVSHGGDALPRCNIYFDRILPRKLLVRFWLPPLTQR